MKRLSQYCTFLVQDSSSSVITACFNAQNQSGAEGFSKYRRAEKCVSELQQPLQELYFGGKHGHEPYVRHLELKSSLGRSLIERKT